MVNEHVAMRLWGYESGPKKWDTKATTSRRWPYLGWGLWDLGKSTAGATCALEPGWERENRWNICVQCVHVVVLFLLQCWWGILWVYYTFHIWFMLYMYIIFNDLMKCILYTWGWLMPRVGRRFAVPLGCFHGVVVCSSIPRMGCTSCCQNYEIMCKSYNQWEFQDPKLEVPTIYKAYFSGLNFSEYPHKIWPKTWY